jgi:hypothetical protein
MERIAIVARLRKGTAARAHELAAAGPPYDLGNSGIERHSIYISSGEAVFVFEGNEIEWIVDELIDARFYRELQQALDQWRAIIDGTPRIAHERFAWEAQEHGPTAPAIDPVPASAGNAN